MTRMGWTGRAPAPNDPQGLFWGFEAHEEDTMPPKTDTSVVRTIGIDTGKNALHMVGLDERGAIVLREKVSRTHLKIV